ncbi:cleavage/polyadenylation specificity factor, 25kDa subunit [Tanacetum coccineum]
MGSWNVRSLTGKLLDLVDVLGRHKVDIACFHETKWKGSRARKGNEVHALVLGLYDNEKRKKTLEHARTTEPFQARQARHNTD